MKEKIYNKIKLSFIKTIIKIWIYIKKSFLFLKRVINKYKFQLILIGIIIFLLFSVASYFEGNYSKFYEELKSDTKPFRIRNVVVFLAAFATAIFTWWKNSINQKNNEIQESERIIHESTQQDELFAQAVGFLKEENDLTTRKAGVHILKDLAVTSPQHVQKCIDMLCSLNESWMPKFLKDYPEFFEINSDLNFLENNYSTRNKNIEELILYKTNDKKDSNKYVCNNQKTIGLKNFIALSQLVMNVLREIIEHVGENLEFSENYNLNNKYLCGGDFSFLDFSKFSDLINANLQSTCFIETNLNKSDLSYSNLMYANLWGTKVQFARLTCTNLKYARLVGADLKFAELEETVLDNAELNGCNLESSDLSRIEFKEVDIMDVNFIKANLEETDFRKAINVDMAIFDDNKNDAIFTEEDYKRLYSQSEN